MHNHRRSLPWIMVILTFSVKIVVTKR